MSDKLKVTFTTINIRNNGEWTGKGEVYYELLVDEHQVKSVPVSNPLKLADGETVAVNQSYSVTKQSGQTLTVEGSVSEKDNLDKDEFASFNDEYTGAGSWGLGTHNRTLRDGNLDVTVNYKVERQ
jgi:hypothetical protein